MVSSTCAISKDRESKVAVGDGMGRLVARGLGGIMEKLHLHWKEENEKKRRIGGRKTGVNLKEESPYKGYLPLNVPYV